MNSYEKLPLSGGRYTESEVKKSLSGRPLITVVTVVYNGSDYIEEAILSVINQTYNNIEYIIIDGGSTDGTVDVIKEYEQAIDYWVSERDDGMYDALNKAMRLSNGACFASLNSDDFYWDREVIQTVVDEVNRLENSYLIYGDPVYMFGEKGIRRRLVPVTYDALVAFGNSTLIPQPTTFISRDLLDRAGSFNTRYSYASDYDFILRCVKNAEKVVHLPKRVSGFRRHDAAITLRHGERMRAESREISTSCKTRSPAYYLMLRCWYYLVYLTRNPAVLARNIRRVCSR